MRRDLFRGSLHKAVTPVHNKHRGDFMSKASMYFDLENLDGKHDEKELKRQINLIPGVISVSVTNDLKRVAVDFDTTGASYDQICKKLDGLGLKVSGESFENHIM